MSSYAGFDPYQPKLCDPAAVVLVLLFQTIQNHPRPIVPSVSLIAFAGVNRKDDVPLPPDHLREHARSFLRDRLQLDTMRAFEPEGEGALMGWIEG